MTRTRPLLAAAMIFGLPLSASADTFTVDDYDLGDEVYWTVGNTSQWTYTRRMEATLNGEQGISFCVDLFHYISKSSYFGTAVDPMAATIASGLNYIGPAALTNYWAENLDTLVALPGVENTQDGITGVQLGIWSLLYGLDIQILGADLGTTTTTMNHVFDTPPPLTGLYGPSIQISGVDAGATAAMNHVLGTPPPPTGYGNALIVELAGDEGKAVWVPSTQNQIPEPDWCVLLLSGLLTFGFVGVLRAHKRHTGPRLPRSTQPTG